MERAKTSLLTDPHKATELLDHALTLAINQKEYLIKANVLILQSKIAFHQQDNFLTQQLLYRAEALLPRFDDPSIEAEIYYLTANIKRKLTKFDDAIGYIKQALTKAEQVNDNFLIYQSLVVKGAIFKDLQQFDKALNTFLIAERYIQDAVPLDKVLVYRNIANAYVKESQLSNAIIYFHKALTIFEEFDMQDKAILTLLDIAKSHRKQGEYSEALQSANKALTLAKKYQNQNYVLKSQVILSRIYRKIGSFEDALTAGLEALNIYEQNNDYEGIALSAKSIGLIYVNLEQYDSATAYFEQILAIPADHIKPLYRVAALREQGFLYLQQNKHEAALSLLDEAQLLYTQLNDETGVASVKKNIGMVYQEKRDIAKAMENFDFALQVATKTNDAWSEAIIFVHKAQLLVNNMPEKSISHAYKAIDIAKDIGAKSILEKAYTVLVSALESNGKYKEALTYSHLKADIINDIKNDSVNQRIAEIRFIQEVKSKMNSLETDKYNERLLKLEFNEMKHLNTIEEMNVVISALEKENAIYLFLLIALVLLLLIIKYKKQ